MERSCAKCGKSLGTRRARQGVRVHPQCKRSALDHHGLAVALDTVQSMLARFAELRERSIACRFASEFANEDEAEAHLPADLQTELRAATAAAEDLLADLQLYKNFVQRSRRAQLDESPA